jgi:hypothetical protein
MRDKNNSALVKAYHAAPILLSSTILGVAAQKCKDNDYFLDLGSPLRELLCIPMLILSSENVLGRRD